MTFKELAEEVLRHANRPLSSKEIWSLAVKQGLNVKLKSSGKTPEATLGARLYVSVNKDPESNFIAVGKRPKRFALKNESSNGARINGIAIPKEGSPKGSETVKQSSKSFLEKDLHPFLAHFAYHHLNCHCKTINHSKSDKKSYGEWVHPDLVGCVYPIGKWDNELLNLSSAVGNTSVKFISFELKKELKLSTLRENFFQTVSNSSWANESYLVAAKVSKNEDFINELARLSSSFGVGVIELNLEKPKASQIKFPAIHKGNLDWLTMNKLVSMNSDFSNFVKRVRIDLNSNEIIKERYDKVLDERQLAKLLDG
ncbi:hypothetical protein KFE98_00545 [bacterium SCSIO 12741]|nr:hypothetical protein KFE98_00545 [bacterium SCSIO 12741]